MISDGSELSFFYILVVILIFMWSWEEASHVCLHCHVLWVSILSKNIQNSEWVVSAYFNEYIGIECSPTMNIVNFVC